MLLEKVLQGIFEENSKHRVRHDEVGVTPGFFGSGLLEMGPACSEQGHIVKRLQREQNAFPCTFAYMKLLAVRRTHKYHDESSEKNRGKPWLCSRLNTLRRFCPNKNYLIIPFFLTIKCASAMWRINVQYVRLTIFVVSQFELWKATKNIRDLSTTSLSWGTWSSLPWLDAP